MRKKSFKGGVHPEEYKILTEDKSFEFFEPEQVIISVSQHSGKDAVPIVKKGDRVQIGSLIAKETGLISAPVHSSICGNVTAVNNSIHFTGYLKNSIVIKSDASKERNYLEPLNFSTVTSDQIISRVKEAGIVGQGGAAFPTHVKLSPPSDKKIEFVILNACECEPYLTRDYRLLLERTDEVLSGLELIMRAVNVRKAFIGIEDNKPKAIEKLREKLKGNTSIEIVVLKTKYPQGAEKMLIKAVTGREVPPGKLPMDVGVIVQNVGTALSIYDAVTKGEPSIYAFLTVSGLGIKEQKNLIVPIGTPIKDIIEYCGGIRTDAKRIVVGGPMMGLVQFDMNVPVNKATSGILVLTKSEVEEAEETNCLRCGMCVDVCPLNLVPTRLVRLIQMNRLEEVIKLNISLCMECGTCAFTCPASIPLVQWLKLGKQKAFAIKA